MGMSRTQFWAEIGNLSIVEPIILSAYDVEEKRLWLQNLGNSPHGQPWSTSFHASAFPGDDEFACGRAAVYSFMEIPDDKPLEAKTRAMFDLGLNLEHDWVKRLNAYGVLLSKDVTGDDVTQTGFVDGEHWLTGNSDAIILPPYADTSHIVEVKTTSHEKVVAMRSDPTAVPYSHSKYIRQCKTYIAMARENDYSPTVVTCEKSGLIMREGDCATGPLNDSRLTQHDGECAPRIIKVKVPDCGTIIYSSREEPLTVATYYVNYDPEFMKAGREKLVAWRDAYLRGELPPHPREEERAKWSVGQCKFCDYKAKYPKSLGGCKQDYSEKVTDLRDSALIDFTKTIRPNYDYDAQRKLVLSRWGAVDLEKKKELA